jgi:hypothetical protein
VAFAASPSVIMSSTNFSFQNLASWNLFEFFQEQKSLKNQYLPHFESKSYHINPAHQRSFQKHQRHIPIPPKFLSYDFISFCSEKIIQYSRTFAPQVQTSWHQAHAPLLVKSFPKTPRTQSEASQFGGSHNYKIKQSKLPSFIDRW